MGVSEGNARDWGGGGGGGGGGIYVCVTEKEREGQQEKGSAVYHVYDRKRGRGSKRKGVQCMCLVNVFACNWMRNCQWIDCCYYVARVGRKDTIIIQTEDPREREAGQDRLIEIGIVLACRKTAFALV